VDARGGYRQGARRQDGAPARLHRACRPCHASAMHLALRRSAATSRPFFRSQCGSVWPCRRIAAAALCSQHAHALLQRRIIAQSDLWHAMQVRVRARLHTIRGAGKSCFFVLRQRMATVQCTVFANDDDGGSISKFMAKYTQQIPKESIVEVVAELAASPKPVTSCTQQDVELKVTDVHVISRCVAAVILVA
jgi:lysyl-tRNA synthetase class II